MSNVLENVSRYAKQELGVEIDVIVSIYKTQGDFLVKRPKLYKAPFDPNGRIGILADDPSQARVLVTEKFLLETTAPALLIHELGHICVTGNTYSDEGVFFGWEFLFAKETGCLDIWLDSMSRNYNIINPGVYNSGKLFGSFIKEDQTEILDYYISYAIEHGFATPDGLPKRVKTDFYF